MTSVVSMVARYVDAWNGDLERVLFGTDDPVRVARRLEGYCHDHLDEVADGIFYRSGVGVVAGLVLTDGRQVVLKVHRWNVSVARLAAVQQVQRHLAAAGLPAPEPMAGPTELGRGLVTAERYRPGTGSGPRRRVEIARELHRVVAAASGLVGLVDVGVPGILRPPSSPLWGAPHSIRFDFEATASGAEWIDELATDARARALAAIEAHAAEAVDVIGHFDWRVENLGFDPAGRVCAIYDWDSLARAPEAVVVGNDAAAFCTDWAHPQTSALPSVTDMAGFVADYELARGRPFTATERALVDASNLYLIAYGARCQHSDRTRYPRQADLPDGGWLARLRQRAGRPLV